MQDIPQPVNRIGFVVVVKIMIDGAGQVITTVVSMTQFMVLQQRNSCLYS